MSPIKERLHYDLVAVHEIHCCGHLKQNGFCVPADVEAYCVIIKEHEEFNEKIGLELLPISCDFSIVVALNMDVWMHCERLLRVNLRTQFPVSVCLACEQPIFLDPFPANFPLSLSVEAAVPLPETNAPTCIITAHSWYIY